MGLRQTWTGILIPLPWMFSIQFHMILHKRKWSMSLLPGVSSCVVYVCSRLKPGLPKVTTLDILVRHLKTCSILLFISRGTLNKQANATFKDQWMIFFQVKCSSVDSVLSWFLKFSFERLSTPILRGQLSRQDIATWHVTRGLASGLGLQKPLCVFAINSVVLFHKTLSKSPAWWGLNYKYVNIM